MPTANRIATGRTFSQRRERDVLAPEQRRRPGQHERKQRDRSVHDFTQQVLVVRPPLIHEQRTDDRTDDRHYVIRDSGRAGKGLLGMDQGVAPTVSVIGAIHVRLRVPELDGMEAGPNQYGEHQQRDPVMPVLDVAHGAGNRGKFGVVRPLRRPNLRNRDRQPRSIPTRRSPTFGAQPQYQEASRRRQPTRSCGRRYNAL